MARQLRVEYPGAIYHVTVRSNGKENLFDDDLDREYFLEWVDDCYKELVEKRDQKEDVSFRRIIRKVPADTILEAVARIAGCGKEHLTTRRRDSSWRCVAGMMLCRYSGMTQREAARSLGLQCGSAISVQMRKLKEKAAGDSKMRMAIARLDRKLAARQR